LHRQIAYSESMVGQPKADTLARVCRDRNSDISIHSIPARISAENAAAILADQDIIFDCTDNLQARLCISDEWVRTNRSKVLISASCVGWCGQFLTLFPGTKACIRCLYDVSDRDCSENGQCSEYGVMGPVVGTIANLQVMELIHYVRLSLKGSGGRPDGQQTVSTTRFGEAHVKIFDFADGIFHSNLGIESSCDLCSMESPTNQPSQTSDSVYTPAQPSHIAEIDSEEFLALLQSDSPPVVVDVRSENQFKLSHIKDSIHCHPREPVRLPDTPDRMLAGVAGDVIVVVCRRGITSRKFVANLGQNDRVVSLKGGLIGLGYSCFI